MIVVGIMKYFLNNDLLPITKSIILVTLSLFLLVVCSSDSFAKNEEDKDKDEGLNLTKVVSKMKKEKIAKPNPHKKLKCKKCHVKSVTKITPKKQARLRYKGNVVKICNSCHKGENLHPVGVDPAKVKVPIKVPRYLPLGIGKYKNKVICTTCHEIHVEKSSENLLRGFQWTTAARYAKFKTHQDFCFSCHKDALTKRSPHEGDDKSCVFCHMNDPEEADAPEATVRLDIIKRCNFCHMKLEDAHFLAVNAFADKTLQEKIPDLNLPFVGGKITCVTCHDQHFESKELHKLRTEFIRFAEQSVRIDLHWTGTFCLGCHDKLPAEGGKPTFLFDNDITAMCNRCHETEEATADIHPVDFEPEASDFVTIPAEFPLWDGLLTCTTCHDLSTQTKIDQEERRKNPTFLRGGPYKSRNDICFKCHNPETYEQQSPHIQLDNRGNIIEEKCLFCHSSRPDVAVVGLTAKIFEGDASTFCYGCHQGKEEGHPIGVTHQNVLPTPDRIECMKKTEKKKKLALPLFDGRVFCGTCHNPHQEGVLKGTAAVGAGKAKKLKLPSGYQMCVACHCDKGSLE
jgi:hypothetical protein